VAVAVGEMPEYVVHLHQVMVETVLLTLVVVVVEQVVMHQIQKEETAVLVS
jgi:hypothetical protein